MAGGGQKSAFAEVGAIRDGACLVGNLLSTLGGLPCLNEFGFSSLAVGDIPDRCRNQPRPFSVDGAQTDLDGKFGPIPALREKIQPDTHRTQFSECEIAVSMSHVKRPEAPRQKLLDRLPDYFVMRIT